MSELEVRRKFRMNVKAQLRPALVLFWLVCLPLRHLAAQQTEEPQAPPFKIEVKVNKVLVPVVVRDAQGRTVGNLRKEDFQVFDKNEPQTISAFVVQTRGTTKSGTENANSSPTLPNASKPSSTAPERFTAFLIDDLHLSTSELGQVQRLGIKMLAGSLTDSNMAAVVSISGIKKRVTVYSSTETRQKSNLWPLIHTSRNTLGMCRNLAVA
jgi:hypothetical protein